MVFEYINKRQRIVLTTLVYVFSTLLILLPISLILLKQNFFPVLLASFSAMVGIGTIIKNITQKPYSSKIKIDKAGLEYISKKKNVQMPWQDICMVGMAKTPPKIKSRVIIISTDYNKEKLSITVNYDNISEDYIFCVYSRELLAEIKKYWHEEIIDEEKIMDSV